MDNVEVDMVDGRNEAGTKYQPVFVSDSDKNRLYWVLS